MTSFLAACAAASVLAMKITAGPTVPGVARDKWKAWGFRGAGGGGGSRPPLLGARSPPAAGMPRQTAGRQRDSAGRAMAAGVAAH